MIEIKKEELTGSLNRIKYGGYDKEDIIKIAFIANEYPNRLNLLQKIDSIELVVEDYISNKNNYTLPSITTVPKDIELLMKFHLRKTKDERGDINLIYVYQGPLFIRTSRTSNIQAYSSKEYLDEIVGSDFGEDLYEVLLTNLENTLKESNTHFMYYNMEVKKHAMKHKKYTIVESQIARKLTYHDIIVIAFRKEAAINLDLYRRPITKEDKIEDFLILTKESKSTLQSYELKRDGLLNTTLAMQKVIRPELF